MKGCCEAQQELHIRTFSTGRFRIEKCILKRVAICEEAG